MLRSEIFESSERLAAGKMYPFEQLKPGFSFFIKMETVNEATFRALVSRMSSLHNKPYSCVKHKALGLLEVGIPNPEVQVSLPIVESSPKAQTYAIDRRGKGKAVYHFSHLPEGYSLTFPINEHKLNVLRVACSIWSKKLKTKFVCITHEDLGIYEVAHLAKFIPINPVQMSPQAEQMQWDKIQNEEKTYENEVDFWKDKE